ncbi:MAG: quinolinate synthase NadA [Spirochaetia bacterium]
MEKNLLIQRINELKEKHKAVILAHNYQPIEIQDVADYTGDSLGLSIEAGKCNEDVIVFCGVSFMAETAKIISPEKTVLLPAQDAGCPMADMITGEQLKKFKAKHRGAKVMCYVNSTAEVKAESNICCTSSNAVKIAEQAFTREDTILFVPDQNLGTYVADNTGRNVINWYGFCPTHDKMTVQMVQNAREQHPGAEVIVHPECRMDVIHAADSALSTGQMQRYVTESRTKEFIIGTEIGMIDRLKKDNPGKEFYPVTSNIVCPNMKKNTLEKVLNCLESMSGEVTLDPEISKAAKASIERMFAYS